MSLLRVITNFVIKKINITSYFLFFNSIAFVEKLRFTPEITIPNLIDSKILIQIWASKLVRT